MRRLFLLFMLGISIQVQATPSISECTDNPSQSGCEARDYHQYARNGTSSNGNYELQRETLLNRLHAMRQRSRQEKLRHLHASLTVPEGVRRHLTELASAVERSRRNPFDGSDLRVHGKDEDEEGDNEGEEEGEGGEGEGEEEVEGEEAHKKASRTDPKVNHRRPLHEPDLEEGDDDNFSKDGFLLYRGDRTEYCEKYHDNYAFFCIGSDGKHEDVVKSFCPSYKAACPVSGSASSSSPADPFTKSVSVITSETSSSSHGQTETERRTSVLLEQVKKRYPCKPDCNRRLHPHCTAECKCDYAYPSVQRFCNPPPLPLFLNTCRLWYHGCPKYLRYHYASQFVYSKAEKGKVLPGTVRNPNPFGLPPPAVPLGKARGATTDRRDEGEDISTVAFVVPPSIPTSNSSVSETPRAKDADYKSPSGGLNAFSRLLIPPEPYDNKTVDPKARQASTFPILPSDATYGAGDAFKQFDGLTDSRGLAHIPQSRSPFTKPGLWQPNPDDPHNRDHANKWWYAPSSVTADWLSGQAQWGAHWAVPAAGTGGTNGFAALHFPSIGDFLNIPDDYD